MKCSRLSPLLPQSPKATSGLPTEGKSWAESQTCGVASFAPGALPATLCGDPGRDCPSLPASGSLPAHPALPEPPQKSCWRLQTPPHPQPSLAAGAARCVWDGSGEKNPFSQGFSKSLGFPHSLLSPAAAAAGPVPTRFSYLTGIFTRRYRSTAMARSARMELSVRMSTGHATIRQV